MHRYRGRPCNFTIDVGRESERTVRSPKDSERSGITLPNKYDLKSFAMLCCPLIKVT